MLLKARNATGKTLKLVRRAVRRVAGDYRLKSSNVLPFVRISRRNFFMPISVVHLTVFYSGHVQGVGFRQATLQVAKEYEVAGFVQNLADGRVLLEAEGAAGVVEAFAAGVQDRMHGYVRNSEFRKQIRVAQFQGFALR